MYSYCMEYLFKVTLTGVVAFNSLFLWQHICCCMCLIMLIPSREHQSLTQGTLQTEGKK